MTQHGETALLVIDVQKGLFEKSTPIYKAEQLLKNINSLIAKARQAGIPVIFIQHSSERILEKGSADWQLHPEMKPLPKDLIVHKLHGNAFEGTDLRAELEKRKVSRVVAAGLVTHGCVKATCLGALDEGYAVVLVSDGHSSYSKDAAGQIEKWNQELGAKGAEVVEARRVKFSRN